MYSANARVEGTRPSLSRELRAALRGVSLTRRQRSELDLTSHRRSGVLDALVPLRDDRGRVYGAVEVKVDRSFATLTDQRTRSYLSAIVHFGRSLGLRVVAEGVQDAATLDFLVALDCDLVQGYHISRPINAEEIDRWLHSNTPPQTAHPLQATAVRPRAYWPGRANL